MVAQDAGDKALDEHVFLGEMTDIDDAPTGCLYSGTQLANA